MFVSCQFDNRIKYSQLQNFSQNDIHVSVNNNDFRP